MATTLHILHCSEPNVTHVQRTQRHNPKAPKTNDRLLFLTVTRQLLPKGRCVCKKVDPAAQKTENKNSLVFKSDCGFIFSDCFQKCLKKNRTGVCVSFPSHNADRPRVMFDVNANQGAALWLFSGKTSFKLLSTTENGTRRG